MKLILRALMNALRIQTGSDLSLLDLQAMYLSLDYV